MRNIREMTELDTKYMQYWGNGAEYLQPTCGYVYVSKDDIPLLVAYLFPWPNKVCLVESMIASPLLSKEDRRNYLKTMVQYLLEKAKTLECIRVIATPTIDSLTRLFIENDFNLYPRKADYLWKEI